MNDTDSLGTQLVNPVVTATGEIGDPLYSLLRLAVDERATDIHLDPVEDGKLVRFRVDGMIHRKHLIQAETHRRILTQVKVAAGFGIDRSFQPDEGMIVFDHEEEVQRYYLRVTIVPAGLNRTAIHFRFVTAEMNLLDFKRIGLSQKHRDQVNAILSSPMGIILVVGVTGSGKSSTLYSIADALDLDTHIGASIEDPIETTIKGLRQVQVDDEHGFSMSQGLRTLLRMDPDVLLIGEIRDQDSAVTAARAGVAGRLVVSTLHAPDPATAIEALNHYRIPPYVTASALRLIITQYLLRRICRECAAERELLEEERGLFRGYGVDEPRAVLSPRACDACRRYGYRGRIGVFEVTTITTELSRDIAAATDKAALLERFRESGGAPLMVDALEKAAAGLVSMEEVHQLYLNTVER